MCKTTAISIFVACGPNDPRSKICPIGNGLFELRCLAGVVEFEPGLTALPLSTLLSSLERYGIPDLYIEALKARG